MDYYCKILLGNMDFGREDSNLQMYFLGAFVETIASIVRSEMPSWFYFTKNIPIMESAKVVKPVIFESKDVEQVNKATGQLN